MQFVRSHFSISLVSARKCALKLAVMLFSIAIVACGAQTGPLKPASLPALMIDPSSAALDELNSIIAEALGQEDAGLAKTVFSKTHIVAMVTKDLSGRVRAMPERFQLLKQGENCVLDYMSRNQTWSLEHVKCVAKNS